MLERSHVGGRTWQVSPDLLGALNSEGYFESSNPAWQTVLGWSEAEVASMSIWEMLHPDDVERTRGGFNLTQQGVPAIGFPNRYRCKDGSYRWISWVGVPVGELVYCSGRDISDGEGGRSGTRPALGAVRRHARARRLFRRNVGGESGLDAGAWLVGARAADQSLCRHHPSRRCAGHHRRAGANGADRTTDTVRKPHPHQVP